MTSLDSETQPAQPWPSRAPAARSCAAVEEGVEQADGDRLDAFVGEHAGGRVDVLGDQRRQLAAVGADAAAHRQAQVARRQHLGERRAVIPLVVADAAADLQRIAEALGGQHADLGALLLEDACWWRRSSRARTARSRAAAR